MRALLDGGARATDALPNGMSALHLAAGAQMEKEARPSDLARWNVIDNDTPSVPRSPEDAVAAVTVLLDAGANPNAVTDSGETPLHAAAAANEMITVTIVCALDPRANR